MVSITSDILFPPEEHEIFAQNIPDVRSHVIDSDFGHDGFLVESEKLDGLIQNFMNEQ